MGSNCPYMCCKYVPKDKHAKDFSEDKKSKSKPILKKENKKGISDV